MPETNVISHMEGGDDFREFQLQVVRMRIAFRQCLQRTLRRHGVNVTFETLQVLSCLWREQGATQQMLAERTARSKASLSSLMNTLEKRGYIERCVGPSDRRNKQVFLSREGERFWLQILPIINELYLRFEQSIGRDRLRDISSDLKRIQNELENL